MTDTPPPPRTARVDLDEVSRVVDALEDDLAAARTDSTRITQLRAEVERLRALLAADQPRDEDVEHGLSGLRDAMHKLGDELVADAFEGSRHIAQIGRILGM